MTKLKGAVIGAGYFSQFHFDAWSRINDVSLTAVCDHDKEKAIQTAAKFDIPIAYSNVEEMLSAEKPDFVDIITRPDSHLALTNLAVSAGVPVICQKPLAPNIEEAKALVAIASDANVPLMIHENFRFQPWWREIKSLLDENMIGDTLHSLSFRSRTGDGWQKDAYEQRQPYFRQMERFLIFEMGVHFIDTFRYVGGEIDGVYASLRKLNRDIAGEDTAIVLFEFANGAEGIWNANRFNEPNAKNPRYTFGEALVEGSGGSIRLNTEGQITIQLLGDAEREHPYTHRDVNFAGDCVLATQRHFVECLLHSKPFETNGNDYLKTLNVQEAIYRSADTRKPVRGIA